MPDKALLASLDFILESIILIQRWSEEIQEPDDYVATLSGKSHFDASLMRLQSIGETLKTIEKKSAGIIHGASQRQLE